MVHATESEDVTIDMNKGPSQIYEQLLDAGEIQADAAQAEAVAALQGLFERLLQPAGPKSGFFDRLLGRQPPKRTVRGLYFWGGVGRGKTWLMDLFYESLPFNQKRRMHFHRFMRHVHQSLARLQGQPSPLKLIAAEFARDTRVLCFDEFFVSDITDAMILAGLLEAMFDRGIALVATSNVVPKHLYENGLQRSKFLPAIDLIYSKTDVLNVDGGTDYRLAVLRNAEIYHSPLDEVADENLVRSFRQLCPDAGTEASTLDVEGRQIQTRFCGDGVVWFDFADICEGPRSQNDYIELAMMFQTVLISNVPRLDEHREDGARRFISLVDEFYDRNVKMVISAAEPVETLYQGDRLVFEFERTRSRLQEMQSDRYLALEHLP